MDNTFFFFRWRPSSRPHAYHKMLTLYRTYPPPHPFLSFLQPTRPVLQRYIWLDELHVGKISVKAGFDITPFPFSYITPRYTRARAEASRAGRPDEQLLKQADRCFKALSDRLGGK